MPSFWIVAALALAPQTLAAAPLDELIAAERTFAAETRERGFKPGFLAWVAPDGFTFQPGPLPARPGLEALPDTPTPGPPLFWWPQYAGIANSGDLGFTTGGATVPVRYFTVWQRQADGSWRWIFDGGPPQAAPLAGGEDDPVLRLPPATAAAGSAEAALAEIAPIEARIAAAAADDAAAAHSRYLAADGLVAGSDRPAFPGRGEQAAELGRQPPRQSQRPIGGIASRAGDLAFTWGEIGWAGAEAPRRGHYARIWQKRTEGWRLVAHILVPAPLQPASGNSSR